MNTVITVIITAILFSLQTHSLQDDLTWCCIIWDAMWNLTSAATRTHRVERSTVLVSREINMERNSLFVEHNEDYFNESKEGAFLITWWRPSPGGTLADARKRHDAGQWYRDWTGEVGSRSSVRAGEDETCQNNNDVVKEADDQTDSCEISVHERITVTTRCRGDGQPRSFESCAVMVAELAIQKSDASRAKLPLIDASLALSSLPLKVPLSTTNCHMKRTVFSL